MLRPMSTGRMRAGAPAIRPRLRFDPSRNPWLGVALVAIAQAALVLGPALRPGLTVVYDMAWAPDPRWTPFVLGVDTPAPRAVPSDAVAVALGHLLGSGAAQKVILAAILTALGIGAAALLVELTPSAGAWGRIGATVAAVWNPYVYERLAVGQWTVLLGLALLPWGMREALRSGGEGRRAAPLLSVVVLAGLGGANSLAIVAMSVVPVLVGRPVLGGGVPMVRTAAAVVFTTIGISAAWSLPAILGGGVAVTETGALAFLPTSDTPLGVVGSLASGGAFWNESTHPASRQVLLVAVAAAGFSVVCVAATLRRAASTERWPLVAGVLLPTAVVLLSAVPALRAGWVLLVVSVPGGGLFRDSHKFMAAWVIATAVGVGVVIELARGRVPAFSQVPVTALLVGLPVALLPVLAWGLGGRLTAVEVPQDFRQSVEHLNDLPRGDVGLLPWNQYRRYDWNGGRVSLTLAPRLVSHVVVYDDALPLTAGTVPGESERAARVTRGLSEGVAAGEAFAAVGVRYVAVERTRVSEADEEGLRDSGRVLIDEPSLLVVELDDPSVSPTTAAGPVLVGWSITLLTVGLVGVAAITGRVVRGPA
jgi:hypothetical protein